MEIDSSWEEDFVLKLDTSVEDDNLIDENDNYKYEQTKVQQPVDSTPSDLDTDKKLCEKVGIKYEIKCESDSQNDEARKRQTTLSEYFTILPPETPVKTKNSQEKMVNVSLLLSQLLNSRVVLNRLPDVKIIKNKRPILRRNRGVQRYCPSCKTLKIDYENLMTKKCCSKCDTMMLYVCDKCNEKHYRSYKCVNRHRILCTSDKTNLKRKSCKKLLVLPKGCIIRQPRGRFMCEHCFFRTNYKNNLKRHLERYHSELFLFDF